VHTLVRIELSSPVFFYLEQVMRTSNLQIKPVLSVGATCVTDMTLSVDIWNSSVNKLFNWATLIYEARHRNETDR